MTRAPVSKAALPEYGIHCEHCGNSLMGGVRFCSRACEECEHESEDPNTGCDGICGQGE